MYFVPRDAVAVNAWLNVLIVDSSNALTIKKPGKSRLFIAWALPSDGHERPAVTWDAGLPKLAKFHPLVYAEPIDDRPSKANAQSAFTLEQWSSGTIE